MTKMITPECCLIIWRAAAREVTKRDLTIVASGTMNSSIGKSTAFFPFPYSLARGPAASRVMSILPGDSGEAERLFRKEAERHSGMIPNAIGA